MSDRPRIVLGEDDFTESSAAPATQQRPAPPASPAPRAQPALPPIAHSPRTTVGSPAPGAKAPAGASPLTDPRLGPLIAAAVAITAGWAVAEVTGIPDMKPTSESGVNASSALWTGVVAIFFVGISLAFDRAVLGGWDAAMQRFAMAVIPAFAVGFIAGYMAQALFTEITQSIFEDAFRNGELVTGKELELYLARMAGWGIFGAGTGLAVGLVDRSQARSINGAIGGAIGGAVGGLVFHYAVTESENEAFSRLLGLLAVGLLIALAVRMVETARREAWLSIVGGGMAGKEFIIYHPLTRIGSSPDCEIYLLKDPGVTKLHAQIEDRGSQRVLTAAAGAATFVNQTPVSTHVLRHGDQVQLGNTVIAYSERTLAPVPPAQQGPWRG